MVNFIERNFPEVRKFFEGLATLPATKPKVFDTFVQYSLFSKKEAGIVIRQGWAPAVKPKRLIGMYGYTPPTGEQIWIDDEYLDESESLLANLSTVTVFDYYTIRDNVHLLLEATTLHELVHWCRQKVNGYNPNRNYEEKVAQQFEFAAYGKRHSVHTLQLSNWIRDPLHH